MPRNEYDAHRYLSERADLRNWRVEDEPDCPMAVFIGLRNVALILLVALLGAYVLAAL